MSEPLLDIQNVTVEYPGHGFRASPSARCTVSRSTFRKASASAWSASPDPARQPWAAPSSGWLPSPRESLFRGEDIAHATRADRRRLAADIQVVFQDPYTSLNPALTVEQILSEPLIVRKVAEG